MSRTSGVTLLELLVVLMLIALVYAVTVPPMLQRPSTAEIKSAARQVAAGLRLARSNAVARAREARLDLDLEKRSFKVSDDPRQWRLPDGVPLSLYTAQRDLIDEKTGSIRFFPDGGSNGGRVSVGDGERRVDVDVDWLTGRVSIAK